MDKNYEIIIAHYNEDIEWLRPYAENVTIYHKWNEENPRFKVKKWIKLNNVWREWHTYIYHIINNFNNLADINIFLQGNISDHIKDWITYDNPETYLNETIKFWFSSRDLGVILKKIPQISYSWKFNEMLEKWTLKRAKLDFWDFYKDLFNKNQPKVIFSFCWGCFWVKKDIIYRRPIEFYLKVFNYLNNHSNPEEWHYIERLWFNIFNDWVFYNFNIVKKIISDILKHKILSKFNKKSNNETSKN